MLTSLNWLNSPVDQIDMICRVACSLCYAILRIQFSAEEFTPRTRSTHSHQCSSLLGPLYEHNSTAFGLTRDSILNTSQYFHVTEGLVPDAMHDVLEGSLAFEIKELLKHLISIGVMSIGSLNEAIRMFPFLGSDVLNKPSPISARTLNSADHQLRQNGMYMYHIQFTLQVGPNVLSFK